MTREMRIIIQLHHSRWSHWFSWNYILLKYPHYRLESILVVCIFSLNVTYCHESSIIPLYWTTYLAFDLENILASNYHNLKWKFNQLPKGRAFLKLFGLSSSSSSSCKAYMKTSPFIGNNSTFGFTHSSNVIFFGE